MTAFSSVVRVANKSALRLTIRGLELVDSIVHTVLERDRRG